MSWSDNAIFYHIYPLGLCGAPEINDFSSHPQPRLEQVHLWLDHIQSMGANAVYLGPLFESGTHGYDTADYYWVDRRLGTNETLIRLSQALHGRGMRLVLDGVFNHTGRNFWAFRDVLSNGRNSPYCDWFQNLRYEGHSPFNDPFSYEGWNGHYNLVKLNLSNPQVKRHIFGAIEAWVRDFQIDGLRLDAADCLDPEFINDLARFCHSLKPDFWLMGEVIHGDYRKWVNPQSFDSVTNYEAYKGLFSSLNDRNYFEIAHTLNRQSGPGGIYRESQLYTFADNHDVNRVASLIRNPAHLYPLYALLFSMPGIPSIYYGSEWGIEGVKQNSSDLPLRPVLELGSISSHAPQPGLAGFIRNLATVRNSSPALQIGDYHPLHISAEQFAFSREALGERVFVALNAAPEEVQLDLKIDGEISLHDLLDPGVIIYARARTCRVNIPAYGARVMRVV